MSSIVIRKLFLWGLFFLIIFWVRNAQKKRKIHGRIESDSSKDTSANFNRSLETKNNIHNLYYNRVISLIRDFDYILVKSKKSEQGFEITFKNYDYNFWNFKRVPTYVKVVGFINSNTLEYSTWSDRYEYGQNSHNEKFVVKFKSIVENLDNKHKKN